MTTSAKLEGLRRFPENRRPAKLNKGVVTLWVWSGLTHKVTMRSRVESCIFTYLLYSSISREIILTLKTEYIVFEVLLH